MQSTLVRPAPPVNQLSTILPERVRWSSTLLMLLGRSMLFFLCQAAIAVVLFLQNGQGWNASGRWWLIAVSIANVINLLLLRYIDRKEGGRHFSLYRFQRETWKQDLLIITALMLVAGPLGFFPNQIVADWLYGDPAAPMNTLLQPLPIWAAAISLFSFPFVHALTELPNYFVFALPRLERLTGSWLAAWLVTSFFLAVQHVFIPLLLDGRFILWRLLMFFPFALFSGWMISWRPRLLPYAMVVHALMDLQLPIFVLVASLPQ